MLAASNGLGNGTVYTGTLLTNGRLVAIKEWRFLLRKATSGGQSTKQKKSVAFVSQSPASECVHEESTLVKQLSSIEQVWLLTHFILSAICIKIVLMINFSVSFL